MSHIKDGQTFHLCQRVVYNGMDCIVTNASIARGKLYQVSPIGRDQYFVVKHWEITEPSVSNTP